MTPSEAIQAVYQGNPVDCTRGEYPVIRDALQAQAGKWIDTGDGMRAGLALIEVKRLDERFAGVDDPLEMFATTAVNAPSIDPWRPPTYVPPAIRPTLTQEQQARRDSENAIAARLAKIMGVHIGVDLGQQQDFSAVCITEVTSQPSKRTYKDLKGREHNSPDTAYRVQHMERIDLGTDYFAVSDRVVDLVAALWKWELGLRRAGDLTPEEPQLPWDLWIDATGVGRPVVEMIKKKLSADLATRRCTVHAVVFTFGDRFTRGAFEGDGDVLGKAYLVSRLQVLMQEGLLRAPPNNPTARDMMDELKNYEIRVTPDANEKYGAFITGAHDDLVTALGLTCIEDPGYYRMYAGPAIWG